MTDSRSISRPVERSILGAVLLLFAVISVIGITWGLPSREIDKYLFGDDPPWSGEKIYRLAGAAEKLTPERAARRGADVDVDVDPLDTSADEPIPLTATEEDVAKIYLRYRLYTYQPDEMITMMALAGMNPRNLQFDPRLYQYGGLFIYPIGGLIAACGLAGLIDVRSDVVYYLDNPDEFGKFYIVARAYTAAWGLLGVVVVFAIARRLGGTRAGLLAALLFTLMPVVVCMAHEGKPHLPGAVLMLMAVLFAMRHLSPRAAGFSPRGGTLGGMGKRSLPVECSTSDGADGMGERTSPVRDARRAQANESVRATREGDTLSGDENPRGLKPAAQDGGLPHLRSRDFWMTCICCGAALGMVLSSWPIFVLIPLVALLEWRRAGGIGEHSSAVQEAGDARANKFAHATRAIRGIAVAAGVFLVINPYILINVFANREVLRSNFGNSLAMYEVARLGDGFIRVLELTVEGATLPVLILGVLALIVALVRRGGTVERSLATAGDETSRGDYGNDEHARAPLGHGTQDGTHPMCVAVLPLAVPAVIFFLQFVLIGAGKPAEYGRFGIFTNTALLIGSAWLLTHRWAKPHKIVNWVPATFVVIWGGFFGAHYLWNFRIDATDDNSRIHLAKAYSADSPWRRYSDPSSTMFAVVADPAPYSYPPMDFSDIVLVKFRSREHFVSRGASPGLLVEPIDRRTMDTTEYGTGLYPAVHPSDDVPLRRPGRMGRWRRRLGIRPRETPISWANKSFFTLGRDGVTGGLPAPGGGDGRRERADP